MALQHGVTADDAALHLIPPEDTPTLRGCPGCPGRILAVWGAHRLTHVADAATVAPWSTRRVVGVTTGQPHGTTCSKGPASGWPAWGAWAWSPGPTGWPCGPVARVMARRC
jgi:hypothetical protein